MTARSGATRSRSARATPITEALLRRWALPRLDEELGKEGRGTVLIAGGSREVPGAVILAAVAALRAGAGRLQVATVASAAVSVGVAIPEARVIGLRENRRGEIAAGPESRCGDEAVECDALLLGPGMTDARALTKVLVAAVANRKHAVVMDAGARPAERRNDA